MNGEIGWTSRAESMVMRTSAAPGSSGVTGGGASMTGAASGSGPGPPPSGTSPLPPGVPQLTSASVATRKTLMASVCSNRCATVRRCKRAVSRARAGGGLGVVGPAAVGDHLGGGQLRGGGRGARVEQRRVVGDGALPHADDDGRDAVADDVHAGPAHVHERVD